MSPQLILWATAASYFPTVRPCVRVYVRMCPAEEFFTCLAADIMYIYTHLVNGHFSVTTQVSRYQKGKTNLDFTEARDSEWQWHQLGHMQVCTSLQTDNHASAPPLNRVPASAGVRAGMSPLPGGR